LGERPATVVSLFRWPFLGTLSAGSATML
jgi:hypothetical protein